jgi:hypothetical protein
MHCLWQMYKDLPRKFNKIERRQSRNSTPGTLLGLRFLHQGMPVGGDSAFSRRGYGRLGRKDDRAKGRLIAALDRDKTRLRFTNRYD